MRLALFAIIGALGLGAYWPGIDGVFFFDSIERIARNSALAMRHFSIDELVLAAFAGEQGYPERAIANISFALNHLLAGGRFSPFAFKLTNFAIHFVNAGLIGFVLSRIVNPWLALLVASAWFLHPIQLTSVLYVVQRMTSLSTTFVVLGLLLFVTGRQRLARARPGALASMALGVVIGAGVGFFAKQNALLMPFLAGLIEWFFFSRNELAASKRRQLVAFYGVIILAPLVVAALVLGIVPELVFEGYRARDFGPIERLLTQSRVMLSYLGMLLVPIPTQFGLYHDDFQLSTSVLSPPSTAVSLLFFACVAIALWWGFKRRAMWAFAISWFIIAHVMESSIIPLEMMHEHRNYLPCVGVLLALGYYMVAMARRVEMSSTMVVVIAALLLATLAAITLQRAIAWKDPGRLAIRLVRDHPDSYRALINAYASNLNVTLEQRIQWLQHASRVKSNGIYPLLQLGALLLVEPMATRAPLFAAISKITGTPVSGDVNDATQSLAQMINARLTHYAVSTDNVVALVQLTDCVIARLAICEPWSQDMERWLHGAVEGARTTDINMTVLYLSLAKLRAADKDAQGAYRYAGEVTRWTPHSTAYRLLEAELHLRLGDRQGAFELLTQLRQAQGYRAQKHPQFRRLQRALDDTSANSQD